ncbi:LysE family translocator [Streptomyces sp. NPDC044780]|uniref:LysE family translocator n=1 Tax=unclassified Streptomyces TaxID=2593676 RepID=UPI0033E6BA3F
MLTHFAAAIGVLGLLTIVPGPDMAVVTRRAIEAGPADALRTVGGIATGLLVWGALTVAGLAAVLAASPAAYLAVKLLGAGYLVFLGVRALWHNRRAATAPAETETETGAGTETGTETGAETGTGTGTGTRATAGSPWRTGLISNVLNPKIAVSYTGLLPTLAPPRLPAAWAMTLLVLLHAGLTLAWLSGYVLLLSKAGPVLRTPRVHRALGWTTGVVLIGFGLAVATTSA